MIFRRPVKLLAEQINSICLVRLSALGDVLMVTPLVRRLQDTMPHVKITWVISKLAHQLVAGMEDVEFIVTDKPNSLRDYWTFKQRMRSYHFDVCLAAQAAMRANLLYPLIRCKRIIGYDSVRAKDGHGWFIDDAIEPGTEHTLEGFLKFADVLGVPKTNIRWDLPISKESHDWALAHIPKGKPIICLNPAASKPERSWPVERYIEVMNHAQTHLDCQLVLIGGPGSFDREMADAILAKVEAIDLVGKTKPPQLMAVIKQASLIICPDTGPSHMASAVGTPVIALQAVTSTKVSGPYAFQQLSVDYYDEAVTKILGKTPATVQWGTHVHGPETMSLIPVEAVIDRLSQVWDDYVEKQKHPV